MQEVHFTCDCQQRCKIYSEDEDENLSQLASQKQSIARRRATDIINIVNDATVLVIDDDQDVHDLLTRLLTRNGFNVLTAYSAEEGLEMARQYKPNIITLDIMMPTMDGWAVLSKLKEDTTVSHIPVVMLSMLDNQSLGFALGATDYLMKPVERDKLLSVLKKYYLRHGDTTISRLLVVEDDTDTRDLFKRTAEREGWHVTIAENGLVGLKALAQQVPDLILLDLMMPEMDGFQFVAEIRKNDAWKNIPIIVVTAKTLDNREHQHLRGQVEQVIQKANFTPEQLVHEIRNILTT